MERKPTPEEAEAAVRILLRYAGDDPDREGLQDTPGRVVRAYGEWFAGYQEDPKEILSRSFEEVEGYQDAILLQGIRLESHCEHHLVPILGEVSVGYLPAGKVVGISKLARVVEAFGKRLQIQEKLTAQIADAIQEALGPQGVVVVVVAEHLCMTTRGVRKPGVKMRTATFRGVYDRDRDARREILQALEGR